MKFTNFTSSARLSNTKATYRYDRAQGSMHYFKLVGVFVPVQINHFIVFRNIILFIYYF